MNYADADQIVLIKQTEMKDVMGLITKAWNKSTNAGTLIDVLPTIGKK